MAKKDIQPSLPIEKTVPAGYVFPSGILPVTPEAAALAAQGAGIAQGGTGGIVLKGLEGTPTTRHTNIMPGDPSDAEKLGTALPAKFTDVPITVNPPPPVAKSATGGAPTIAKATPVAKPEEKKPGGINWLAVLTDAASGAAQEAGGQKATSGYTDAYLQQQEDRQKAAQAFAQKYLGNVAAGNGDTGISQIPGYKMTPGIDLKPASIDKAREIAGGTVSAMQSVDKLGDFINKNPNVAAWDLNKRKEFDNLREYVVAAARLPIAGPGTYQEAERNMVRNMLPKLLDPTETPEIQKMKINQAKDYFRNTADQHLKLYGLEPEQGGQGQQSMQLPSGKIMINPKTGEKIQLVNGKWQPLK